MDAPAYRDEHVLATVPGTGCVAAAAYNHRNKPSWGSGCLAATQRQKSATSSCTHGGVVAVHTVSRGGFRAENDSE